MNTKKLDFQLIKIKIYDLKELNSAYDKMLTVPHVVVARQDHSAKQIYHPLQLYFNRKDEVYKKTV